MAQVILIGEDWRSRALLRAQLIEEGLSVEAYELLSEALRSPPDASIGGASPSPPSLLIADISASVDAAAEVARLAPWSKWIPIWIIASRSAIQEKELRDRGFEAVLFRPVDIGELVERVKRRIRA